MNHSIITANRSTHVKIVVVALVAAIMVVTVGIAARLTASSGIELAGHPKPPTTAGVVKPSKPVWTETTGSTIR
jgi:hypothetical protein